MNSAYLESVAKERVSTRRGETDVYKLAKQAQGESSNRVGDYLSKVAAFSKRFFSSDAAMTNTQETLSSKTQVQT